MIKINLIADLQEKKLKTKKLNNYALIGSVLLVVVVLAAVVTMWGVIGVEKAVTASTNNKIEDTNKDLAKYKDLETVVISLEKGLAQAKEILNGKDQWTKLLTHLESATPADVQFTTLKLQDGSVTADLAGKDVNSLARFMTSYKNYQVIVVSGTGTEGQTITFNQNGQSSTTKVKNNGTWSSAFPFDSTKDLSITITGAGPETLSVKYTSADRKLTSDAGVSAKVKNLYSNLESKGYTKDATGKVTFSVTMNFDGAALW